jgi:lysozyme family protein
MTTGNIGSRRQFVANLLAGSFALAAGGPVYAARARAKVNPPADAFLPAIEDLERQANALNLPGFVSAGPNSAQRAANPYFDNMRRLVDLQDRSQFVAAGAGVADKTGAVLSKVNAGEHMPTGAFVAAAAAPAPRFADIKRQYDDLLNTCVVKPKHQEEVDWYVATLKKYRPRYEAVSSKTHIPWYFIGILHGLEASFNFRGHLHNGDPLSAVTIDVPAGRPIPWLPPSDWESSAVDALTIEHFTNRTEWTTDLMLYRFEAYNGFGSRRHGINTPYLWSYSNHYTAGRYIRDGKWSATTISKECGAAVMLKALIADGTVMRT